MNVQPIDSSTWLAIDFFVTSGNSALTTGTSSFTGLSHVLQWVLWSQGSEMVYLQHQVLLGAWWKVESLGLDLEATQYLSYHRLLAKTIYTFILNSL